MASALAWARVKHDNVPAGAVSPVFRASIHHKSLALNGACRRARISRAPVGRVIPLRSGRPCPCYPRSHRRAGLQRSAST
jgi:hypothetical protein